MEKEIDLVDYIKIFIKRKRIILGITAILILIAAVWSFITPKTYNVDIILEVGQIEDFIPEAPSQLVEKIKNDSYGKMIKESLEIDTLPVITASNPQDTRLVIISVVSSNLDEAIAVLDKIEDLILKEHQEKFDAQKNVLLDDKKRIENKISVLEKEKEISQEKIDYFTKLQAETPSITNHIFLTEAKESFEKKNLEIEKQYLSLNSFLRQLESYQQTRAIKSASAAENTVESRLVVNIVAALFFGLFIGVLTAFIQEFWEKNQKRLKI